VKTGSAAGGVFRRAVDFPNTVTVLRLWRWTGSKIHSGWSHVILTYGCGTRSTAAKKSNTTAIV